MLEIVLPLTSFSLFINRIRVPRPEQPTSEHAGRHQSRSLFQRRPLISRQLALGRLDAHKRQHHDQRNRCTSKLVPENRLITPLQPQMRRARLQDVRKRQQERDAQIQQTIDQGAREALPFLRQVGRDEDAGDVEGDVDADGGADHGGEDVGPVVGAKGRDGEEERRQEPAETRDQAEDGAGDQVQDVAA